MSDELVLVLDCGSTNIAACVVNTQGRVVASASRPNAATPDPQGPPGWYLWDLDAVLGRMCSASLEALASVAGGSVRAVTVTTWGADGAPAAADGSLLHPVISWQCDRTKPLADEFADLCDRYEAFCRTGYQVLPFNTILKLVWLRRNAPQTLDRAHAFVMMPGLLSHRLCGEITIDATEAGTTMATDLSTRGWSEEMLRLAGVSPSLFPRWVEPGEVIGALTPDAASLLGLDPGIPVVAAGHDTQFAIAGSAAPAGEAVLSSGTWEILATRTAEPDTSRRAFEDGLLIEFDAEPGLTNPQLLMMGSGVLEWVRDRLYGDAADRASAYEVMIAEASEVRPGSGGVVVLPSFVQGAGPTKRWNTGGGVLGLELDTTRGQVYRAALEGLAFQLRHALEVLFGAEGARATAVRAVGGGSRNALWNQIRADVCGLPIVTLEQKEATVLGAAMYAFVGAGVFASAAEARAAATVERVYEPSEAQDAYSALYARYRELPPALKGFHA